jgi:TonB family protein
MKAIPALVLTSLLLLLASCASSGTSLAPAPSVSPSAAGEKIYDLEELDQKPVIKGRRAAPTYPFELKKRGIQGEALVTFVVDTQGKVRDLQIVRADHSEFAKAGAAAAVRWEFTPGRKDGVPVNTRMQIPIGFRLNQ